MHAGEARFDADADADADADVSGRGGRRIQQEADDVQRQRPEDLTAVQLSEFELGALE